MAATQNRDMGSGSIPKLLAQLALPAVVAQVVNLLYNIVDRIYIGHMPEVGASALTGVGLFTPILMLITAFAMLCGSGGAPRAAIAMGRGDDDAAEKIMGNCFTLLLILAAVLTVVFYFAAPSLLVLFGASEKTLPYALDYARIYIIGTIFVLIVMGMNPFVTTQGFATFSMMTTVIGAVCNIILDPILIFALNMGVRGAATATVISQAVGAVWVLRFLTGSRTRLRLSVKNMPLVGKVIGPCLGLGVSTFVMIATESILSISFNSSLARYGGDIAAIACQAGVEADGKDTFGGNHHKGGNAQPKAGADDFSHQRHVFHAQAQPGAAAGQKAQHPHRAHRLADDSRRGGTAHPHIEGKNQDGVQDDVAHSADHGGHHAERGKALGGDKGVHAHNDEHKNGADDIDAGVIQRIRQRFFAGTEQHQQGRRSEIKHNGQHSRQNQQQRKAVAHDFFSGIVIAAAHGNGRAGRAAGAAQHGKRGNQHQNGGKQANARQRGCADLRHMADIDAVHNVIQQVYHLRHHRGQCQLGQQLGNAAAPHIPVLRCSHNQSTSCVFVVKKWSSSLLRLLC